MQLKQKKFKKNGAWVLENNETSLWLIAIVFYMLNKWETNRPFLVVVKYLESVILDPNCRFSCKRKRKKGDCETFPWGETWEHRKRKYSKCKHREMKGIPVFCYTNNTVICQKNKTMDSGEKAPIFPFSWSAISFTELHERTRILLPSLISIQSSITLQKIFYPYEIWATEIQCK